MNVLVILEYLYYRSYMGFILLFVLTLRKAIDHKEPSKYFILH